MNIFFGNMLLKFPILIQVIISSSGMGVSTDFKFELDNPSNWVDEHNSETNFYEMMDFAEKTCQFVIEKLQDADSHESKENKIKVAFQALGYIKMLTFDLMGELVCQSTKSEIECKSYYEHPHIGKTREYLLQASKELEKYMWLFGTSAPIGLESIIFNLLAAQDALKILTIANSDLIDIDSTKPVSKLPREVRTNNEGVYERSTYFGVIFGVGSFLFYLLFKFSRAKCLTPNIIKKLEWSL